MNADQQETERPLISETIDELRERVATLRHELSNRGVRSARRLREEIDPDFNIDRPQDNCVYVVELDDAVRDVRRFTRKNPDARADHPCLYVGSTAKTREERFEEHKEGGEKASGWVRDFGVRLRPEFTFALDDLVWDEARHMEEELAELLRSEGYGVWQA